MNGQTETVTVYRPARFDLQTAIADFALGLKSYSLWSKLAMRDTRSGYRGASVGPLWIVLISLATILGLGVVYSQIFARAIEVYLPFVGLGITIWTLISAILTGGTNVFLNGAQIFKQIPVVKTLFIYSFIARLLINFGYRMVVALAFVFWYVPLNPTGVLLALVGVLLLAWTGFWYSVAFSILSSKVRDVGQAMQALSLFAFFLTPVFWQADRLGPYKSFINFNPFYHYMQVIRGPLLGEPEYLVSLVVVLLISGLMTILGLILYAKFHNRLPYWC